MKKNEKLFPEINLGVSSKRALVKSKSNVRNNRVGNFESYPPILPDNEGEGYVVVVKSKSNVRNNRMMNFEDGDVIISTGSEQMVVVVKSKSNVRNN